MNAKILLLLTSVSFATTFHLQATAITFNLRDTGATSEIESGTITRGGVTAILTPHVVGANGVLNQTSTGFGINADGGSDLSDQIDNGAGAESISITFDTDIHFTGLTLSSFSTTEHALLTIGGFSPLSLTGLAAANDTYSFAANNTLLSGQTLLLQVGDGNGFSFDSFTIDALPSSSVPDSLPFGFTACFFLGFLVVSQKFLGETRSVSPLQLYRDVQK